MKTETITKSVPATALRLSVACEFGDNGNGAKTAPVKMIARSGDPIDHWYWGKVIHDLAGMKLRKPRIPIDYAHADDEVIGYLNKFDTSTGDLVVSGAVVPFGDDDRASEVIYKAREGVPYEASINFGGDGIKIEELGRDQIAEVNGRRFEGPGVIIREWPLRGVAICPYGADSGTSTQLSASDREIAVTFTKGSAMKNETEKASSGSPAGAVDSGVQTKLSEAPATETPAVVDDKPAEGATPTVAPVETGKPAEAPAAAELSSSGSAKPATFAAPTSGDYIAAFGDRGARWYLEGRAFSACVAEFAAEKDAKIAELTAKLADAPRGDPGVSFSTSEGSVGAKEQQLAPSIGDNLAKFAAGIKFAAKVKR